MTAILLKPTTSKGQKFVDQLADIFEYTVDRSDRPGQYSPKLIVAPIISYKPATSWAFGVGSKFLFKPGQHDSITRCSNAPMALQYSLRNQIVFATDYLIFFDKESWLLKGSFRLQRFPIYLFRPGSESSTDDKISVSYNNLLVEPLLLKRVWKKLFLGGGWRYTRVSNLEYLKQKEPSSTRLAQSFTASGLEMAISYDSRNNVLNAVDGLLIEFTHGEYGSFLNSSHDYALTKFDLRSYWAIDKDTNSVFAAMLYGKAAHRNVPYLEKPGLGGPTFLRGYQKDRYRSDAVFGAQVEWRQNLGHRIGAVAFAGFGDVLDYDTGPQWHLTKFSVGTGLRFALVESERLNLRVDYGFGFGHENAHNYYFGLAEAF